MLDLLILNERSLKLQQATQRVKGDFEAVRKYGFMF